MNMPHDPNSEKFAEMMKRIKSEQSGTRQRLAQVHREAAHREKLAAEDYREQSWSYNCYEESAEALANLCEERAAAHIKAALLLEDAE